MPQAGGIKVMKDTRIPLPFSGSESALPESLYLRVRASVEREKASSSSMPVRVIVALIIASCLTAAVVLVASRIVYQRLAAGVYLAARSTPHLLLVLLLLAGLTLAATFVAISRGRRGFGSGLVSLAVVAALVAPIYAALILVSPVHTDDPMLASVTLSPWGGRCLAIASIIGTMVLASFTIALRRSAPVASRVRGGTLGAAAGAWAGLSIFIFCPSGSPLHLLVGHVLPVVALTLLGFIVVPRALHP
jgi:hypothetical protein